MMILLKIKPHSPVKTHSVLLAEKNDGCGGGSYAMNDSSCKACSWLIDQNVSFIGF